MPTRWRNKGGGRSYSDLQVAGYAHNENTKLTYRVGQEYWQSLSDLHSAARAGSDKIKKKKKKKNTLFRHLSLRS